MRATKQTVEVTVAVSKPYVVIGGGWTGLRPQGMRRTYTATFEGTRFENTTKAEIQSMIRQRAYREHGNAVRVTFTFVETGEECESFLAEQTGGTR